jgi:hypothetical protein
VLAVPGDPAGGVAAAKSNPHASQNCPDLSVPHRGHGSAGLPGAAVTVEDAPGEDVPAAVVPGEAVPGEDTRADGAAPMRIPQTSQKSVLSPS